MDLNNITNEVLKIVKKRMEKEIQVEASGRHIHLSEEHLKFLVGDSAELNPIKYLSQPGQFASQLRLTILGPKGALHNVVVLGPTREKTQVEISLTDSRHLGIAAPVRLSGDIKGSPGITLINGNKSITIEEGVIIAQRHIHVAEQDADFFGVLDGEKVQVKLKTERPLIFKDVKVRVSSKFQTAMHIDYDEANACGFRKGDTAIILKEWFDNEYRNRKNC